MGLVIKFFGGSEVSLRGIKISLIKTMRINNVLEMRGEIIARKVMGARPISVRYYRLLSPSISSELHMNHVQVFLTAAAAAAAPVILTPQAPRQMQLSVKSHFAVYNS